MLTITYLVLIIDAFLGAIGIIGAMAYWILQPADIISQHHLGNDVKIEGK